MASPSAIVEEAIVAVILGVDCPMTSPSRLCWPEVCFVAAVLLVVASVPASAYIDPGTGSFVLQAVLAGLLAVGFVLKSTWKNVTGVVARLFGRDDTRDR